MTERAERLLLTLYGRGRPAKRPRRQTLERLRGYVSEDGLALTELGREHCRAVLAGKKPPQPPGADPAGSPGQAMHQAIVKFLAAKGKWPTLRELAEYRGIHLSGAYKALDVAVEHGLVEIEETAGPRRSMRIRAAAAASMREEHAHVSG